MYIDIDHKNDNGVEHGFKASSHMYKNTPSLSEMSTYRAHTQNVPAGAFVVAFITQLNLY